ncbi:MAG TPA: hypothetical protein VMG10_19275 [Gemmataceae bacterium]|nr:hypothetical protein [Gemmataceae bacterium]
MPRKPKSQKKTITIIVNAKPIAVIMHPPTKARRSWYAYWNGLVASRSTGRSDYQEAIQVVEDMVRSWLAGEKGHRSTLADAVLSDEEFEAIQRTHFDRHQDPAAKARAAKSLKDCLEAIQAFRTIIRMEPIHFTQPIAAAPADVCAAFQRKALTLPKNWRSQYPKSKKTEEVQCIGANTIIKWSRSLQAAFHRANRNAGRKCVRGVVAGEKLLTENPWTQFTWIEGNARPIRQFDREELLSLLDHLETRWAGVSVALLFAKVCLWSQCRRTEVTTLRWDQLRIVGNERHFEVVGKWSVEKWFRIPEGLYQELMAIQREEPFVFAAYNDQLREFYEKRQMPWKTQMVGVEFKPENLGDWFHERLIEWSRMLPKGRATTHVFRKTSLQYALSGESVSKRVAEDARVSEGVLLRHYAKVTDPARREQSNRNFARIVTSLDADVAAGYGHAPADTTELEARLRIATETKDWALAAELIAELTALRADRPA